MQALSISRTCRILHRHGYLHASSNRLVDLKPFINARLKQSSGEVGNWIRIYAAAE
jgi:hypothetical protein